MTAWSPCSIGSSASGDQAEDLSSPLLRAWHIGADEKGPPAPVRLSRF